MPDACYPLSLAGGMLFSLPSITRPWCLVFVFSTEAELLLLRQRLFSPKMVSEHSYSTWFKLQRAPMQLRLDSMTLATLSITTSLALDLGVFNMSFVTEVV